MPNTRLQTFLEALQADGWVEIEPFRLEKSHWKIVFDTSHWMELGTATTPRIFDVPVPTNRRIDNTQWTINLINHLFVTNDRLESLSR